MLSAENEEEKLAVASLRSAECFFLVLSGKIVLSAERNQERW